MVGSNFLNSCKFPFRLVRFFSVIVFINLALLMPPFPRSSCLEVSMPVCEVTYLRYAGSHLSQINKPSAQPCNIARVAVTSMILVSL